MQSDARGLALLRDLGARTVPVVSRGQRWVSGQSLAAIAELLGLDEHHAPELEPAEIAARLDAILAGAARLVRQLPEPLLERDVRNRKRSLRVLSHHIFRIPEAFLECAEDGVALAYDALVSPPAPDASAESIARYGEAVRVRVGAWWASGPDPGTPLETYYGEQSVHQLLERTAWHCGQHVRQLEMVLEAAGISPDAPPAPEVYAGLPMPEKVWDDD